MSDDKKPILKKQSQKKGGAKKSASCKHGYDITAEHGLFGDPQTPDIEYYCCKEHGKFPPNKVMWIGNKPMCPTGKKKCGILKKCPQEK